MCMRWQNYYGSRPSKLWAACLTFWNTLLFFNLSFVFIIFSLSLLMIIHDGIYIYIYTLHLFFFVLYYSCFYIYIHICTHTHIHKHVDMDIQMFHICMYICMYYAHICAYRHICAYTYICWGIGFGFYHLLVTSQIYVTTFSGTLTPTLTFTCKTYTHAAYMYVHTYIQAKALRYIHSN